MTQSSVLCYNTLEITKRGYRYDALDTYTYTHFVAKYNSNARDSRRDETDVGQEKHKDQKDPVSNTCVLDRGIGDRQTGAVTRARLRPVHSALPLLLDVDLSAVHYGFLPRKTREDCQLYYHCRCIRHRAFNHDLSRPYLLRAGGAGVHLQLLQLPHRILP